MCVLYVRKRAVGVGWISPGESQCLYEGEFKAGTEIRVEASFEQLFCIKSERELGQG